MDKETLYIVIPCYNEEEMLPITIEALEEKMNFLINNKKVSKKSKVMLVDDGSKDKTWELITELDEKYSFITGIKLSRNKGHQNALLAGLMTAKERADIVISMDADLQDDINAIDGMLEKRAEGCDVVYGVRSSRKKDTFFKRFTAQAFYKLLKFFGVDIIYNHADYRLMSKRALNSLEEFKEVNLFLRGIVPMVGFKSDTVEYERNERTAGESKYPLSKMLAFAFEGITSLSVKPIRAITAIGITIFSVSVVFILYFIIVWLLGKTVAGWTTIVLSVWALGGFQILAIGIVGEYIGKIYLETKARPKFIIETDLEIE